MPALKTTSRIDWPLMNRHVTDEDFEVLIEFLKTKPRLTQSTQVQRFEEEWSRWLGTRHSVMVHSGSAANLISLALLKETFGEGEVIVSPLNWISDIWSIVCMGFTPVFVDIELKTLGMDNAAVLEALTPRTRAVMLTHILGLNAFTSDLAGELKKKNIWLVEDVCESYGATWRTKKLGTFGTLSNFSFYFGHHLTTVEGGMVSTDDENLYQTLRMLRAHGMVRESSSPAVRSRWEESFPDLHGEFIFAHPGFNMRATEIEAVLGRNQLPRLDDEILVRNSQYRLFLDGLDRKKFYTEFAAEGMSNYGFVLMVREKDSGLQRRVMQVLEEEGVEFRRGLSGGGNQLRQPYFKKWIKGVDPLAFTNVEHAHHFGFYFGNYPEISSDRIQRLAERLNHA